MNEQNFALHEKLNEIAMYQKLSRVAVKHDSFLNDNTKGEKQSMKALFGNRNDFYFKLSLIEETMPSQSNVGNNWIGNGNSEIDGVAQSIDLDKIQWRNGHRKHPKKKLGRLNLSQN